MLPEKKQYTEGFTGSSLNMKKEIKLSPKNITIDSSVDLDFVLDSSFVFKEPEKKEIIVYKKQENIKGLF